MDNFLKTINEIELWLQDTGVKNYMLIPDEHHGFVVDVKNTQFEASWVNNPTRFNCVCVGGVDLAYKNLTSIAIKFNDVSGYFNCAQNALTSLKGCPESVGEYFSCHHNQLTSLEFCPQSVGTYFYCMNNLLTSLKFSPPHIHGDFYCHHNSLENLEHGPQTVDGFYACYKNKITSLLGCPDNVGEGFYCHFNHLSSIDFCPHSVGGDFFCTHNPLLGDTQDVLKFQDIQKIHRAEVQIKKEKSRLSNQIKKVAINNPKSHKI